MTIAPTKVDGDRIPLTSFAPFLLITFGLAWGIVALFVFCSEQMTRIFGTLTGEHPLFYLAVYAPAIAASIVVIHHTGIGGLRRFLRRLLLWRAAPPWYAFLLVGIPLLFACGAAWKGDLRADLFPFSSLHAFMLALILMGIKGPVEEFGWRGLALPLLQRKLAPIWSGLIVGIVWGFWHLPAFLLSGTPQSAWSFGPFFMGSIALSLIMTSLFNASHGSILLPALFHFQVINPAWPDAQPYDSYAFAFAALVVVWIDRERMFNREGGVAEIIPPLACGEKPSRSKEENANALPVRAEGACVRRRHGNQLQVLLLLGLLFEVAGCPPAHADRLPLKHRFQQELDALHRQYQFPGATAAYLLPDGTVEVVATGLADIESEIKMFPQSRMLTASIGKTFVAATVLALVQEGLLALDDPITTWLDYRPWFSRLPNRDTITLRHLLTHQSGLENHVATEGFRKAVARQWSEAGPLLSPEASIAFVLDQPPLFEAGAGWHYSDTGYLLAGLVIERATGHSYYDVVRRRFLDPLGLALTTPSNRLELPGLAAGYTASDNPFGLPSKTTLRPGVMAWHPGVEWTGGGFIGNSRDLVVWARALFERRALRGPYMEDLLQSVPVSDDDPDTRYGLGVGIHTKGPLGPTYGHGGWIPGYCTSLRYYPKHGVAVAFQINTDIGIVDGSTPVIEDTEVRLARMVISAASD